MAGRKPGHLRFGDRPVSDLKQRLARVACATPDCLVALLLEMTAESRHAMFPAPHLRRKFDDGVMCDSTAIVRRLLH